MPLFPLTTSSSVAASLSSLTRTRRRSTMPDSARDHAGSSTMPESLRHLVSSRARHQDVRKRACAAFLVLDDQYKHILRPLSSTQAKIAKMEAKLRQMEQVSAGSGTAANKMHPSLPPKPVPTFFSSAQSSRVPTPRQQSAMKKPHTPLPSLPLLPQTNAAPSSISPSSATSLRTDPPRRTTNPLTGVRIVKKKT